MVKHHWVGYDTWPKRYMHQKLDVCVLYDREQVTERSSVVAMSSGMIVRVGEDIPKVLSQRQKAKWYCRGEVQQ